MTYEIHSNIPVPPKRKAYGKSKFMVNQLKVDQCIILKTPKELKSAREAAYRYSCRNPKWKYTTRRLENPADGWGLWRIK